MPHKLPTNFHNMAPTITGVKNFEPSSVAYEQNIPAPDFKKERETQQMFDKLREMFGEDLGNET